MMFSDALCICKSQHQELDFCADKILACIDNFPDISSIYDNLVVWFMTEDSLYL